jgi:hypothetical protein
MSFSYGLVVNGGLRNNIRLMDCRRPHTTSEVSMTYIKMLAAVFALLLFAATSAPAQRDDRVVVSSPLHGFSIKMPGKPKETPIDYREGKSTEYLYNDAAKSIVMILIYTSLKEQPNDAEALLRYVTEEYARGARGKIVSLTRREYKAPVYGRRDGRLTVETRTYPGLEASVKATDRRVTHHVMAFVDARGLRFFMMAYTATDERFSATEAKRFFDSFTLLY